MIPHASSIIRVKETDNHTFDKNLLLGQDTDFMMRILKAIKIACEC